eukprot:gene35090-45419_t
MEEFSNALSEEVAQAALGIEIRTISVHANANTIADVVDLSQTHRILDGVEATRLLRKVGYKNLVIGVTGNVMDDDVIAFQDAGVDFVMAKPVKMNLLSTILAYVKNEGSLSRP